MTIRKFLWAMDTHHAHLTAQIDFGWERVGPISYRDQVNDEVRILKQAEDLRGLRDFKVYRGHNFHLHSEHRMITYLIESYNGELISGPRAVA